MGAACGPVRSRNSLMNQSWVRWLAYFEIVGALLILGGGWYRKHNALGDPVVSFPIVTYIAAAFTLGAGGLLLAEERVGVSMSLLVQCLQIVQLNYGLRFVLLAGPEINLLLASVGTRVEVGGGGAFALLVAPPDGTLLGSGVSGEANFGFMAHQLSTATWAVAINLVALCFFVRLWRLDEALTAEAKRAAKQRFDEETSRP
ncbi:MAG: hypothetical protein ACREN6_03840 [Gemmatimonadaceae bacterium]